MSIRNGICSQCERSGGDAPAACTRRNKVAAILLALFAFAVIAPDFGRVLPEEMMPSGLYPLGTVAVEVDNDGLVTGIQGGDPRGLVVGDRIEMKKTKDPRIANGPTVYVACQPEPASANVCSATQDLVLADKPHGHDTVSLPARPEVLNWKNADTWGLFVAEIAAFAFIAFCWLLVWRRPGLQTWGLFLFSIWFNPGQYFVWCADLPARWLKAFYLVQSCCEALGLAGILLFALSFPENSVIGWRRRAVRLLPALFVILLAVRLSTFGNFLWGSETQTLNRVWYGITVASIFTMAGLLAHRWVVRVEDRPQISMLWFGVTFGLGSWVLIDSHETIGFPPWDWLDRYNGFLYAAVVALPITAYFALRQLHVIGTLFVIRRAFVVVLFAGVSLAITEMLVHSSLSYKFHWLSEHEASMTFFVALLGLVHNPAHHLTEIVFFRRWHHVMETLRKTIASLTFEKRRVAELHELVLDETVNVLGLKCGALYRTNEKNTFVLERHYGIEVACKKCGKVIQSKLATMHPDEPVFSEFLIGCQGSNKPVRLPANWTPKARSTGFSTPVHAIPIIHIEDHQPHLTRIVFLGPHLMGQNLDPDEVEILDELAKASAAAYLMAQPPASPAPP